MLTLQRITLTLLAALAAYALMPGAAEPPPAMPTSVLGPAPALEPVLAAVPVAAASPAARASAAPMFTVLAVTPGPFAPRPRPPTFIAFGAAAPLASGQDVSGYWWGGVKPDLSD